MPAVELRNISKKFGDVRAVDDVSLSVEEYEYVTIIGPSGCGKTTLLRMIAGIIEPDQGQILLRGRQENNTPPEDREIGYLFQNILLFPHMDVMENVEYAPLVKGESASERSHDSKEILSLLRLSLRTKAMPNELSRGLQQKVALARTLASASPILLLDEPLSSLDARVRVELRYELKRIVKTLQLTAIHVTHDQDEALSLSDKIVVMRKGRIEQIGTPKELYYRPKTLFVSRFMGGESNFVKGEIIDQTDGVVRASTGRGPTFMAHSAEKMIGTKAILSFKPEHILLGSSPDANQFEGTVREVNFLGALSRLAVETPMGEIVVKTPRTERSYSQGEHMNLYIKPENVLAFPFPSEGLERAIEVE